MYFVRIPYIIKKLFPQLVWERPNPENNIFLTFDDGPHPEITPWVLLQLKKYDAKATFFCLGKNAEKHPEIIQRILSEGHSIGNHGNAHLNGWKTKNDEYLKDFLKGHEILKQYQHDYLPYRPAYGKIKRSQIAELKSVNPNAKTEIINWSLMPGDFDEQISSEQCYLNLKKIRSGDIVVLHDSEQARKHLEYCLPKFLEFCKENNFSFDKLNHQKSN